MLSVIPLEEGVGFLVCLETEKIFCFSSLMQMLIWGLKVRTVTFAFK